MRKIFGTPELNKTAALALAASVLCAAPAAFAQSPAAPQALGAQFLTLGASSAYAFRDSSSGSALAQITRAQDGGAPAPAAAPASAVFARLDLTSPARAPALIRASYTPEFSNGPLAPIAPLAAPAAPARPFVHTGPDPSVFGSVAMRVSQTAFDGRWRRAVSAPQPVDARWREAVRAISLLPPRERVQAANAWVNHAVAFESDDLNYGVSDYWASARETMARGRGDCEDYAIAKMELLREAGVPSGDLYLLIARDLVRRADHALLLVRLDDGYWVLDSGTDRMLPAEQVADYRPIVTFSSAGEWMHGFHRTPGVTLASLVRVTPAFGR
jgi:predicted transglutaminase-like cysteine proteinase